MAILTEFKEFGGYYDLSPERGERRGGDDLHGALRCARALRYDSVRSRRIDG